jgi:hypothetical protein
MADSMEQETGIEPATFSLGMWSSIEKGTLRSPDLVPAIKNTEFSQALFYTDHIEQKGANGFQNRRMTDSERHGDRGGLRPMRPMRGSVAVCRIQRHDCSVTRGKPFA